MSIRNLLRGLALGTLATMAIMGVPVESAHARDNISHVLDCELRGFKWIEGSGCADRSCQFGGQSYTHGQEATWGGKRWICNGLTGQWREWIDRTSTPMGPDAPRPTTNHR
jgi:hypothetical protein